MQLFAGELSTLAKTPDLAGKGRSVSPIPAETPPPWPREKGPPDLQEPADQQSIRRFEPAALLQLAFVALLLPVTALALAPAWLVLYAFTGWPYWPVLVAYLALGGTLFLRPVQQLLLRTFFKARKPTAAEYDWLAHTWHTVLDQAGIPPDRYVLAVSDSSAVNAFATGGHVVAVTRGAMERLPPAELEGVLAHELGHHLGLHTVAPLASYWLQLPILWLARLGNRLERIAVWFANGFAAFRIPGAALVGVLISSALRLAAWVLLLAIRFVNAVTPIVQRRAEYNADQAAVELGYGPHLSAALQRFAAMGMENRLSVSIGSRLTASHPPLAKRIQRIRSSLQ